MSTGSRLLYPGLFAIRECCWACKGTGRTFAGVNPLRFRRCFMCYGAGGRGAPRTTSTANSSPPLETPPDARR